ncbi:hypothetical protein TCAL_15632, partial [Tigriopus californicus]
VNRIGIPPHAVKVVLQCLHASHQGLEKTKRRARQTVCWPGFDNDSTTTVETCAYCQTYRSSHVSEAMEQDPMPTRAFDVGTSGLFLLGSNHSLVYAERNSGFPMLAKFADAPNSSDVMKLFRGLFSLIGTPRILRLDNINFLRDWGGIWKPSSPYHSKSNDHAEVSVEIVKRLLQKTVGDLNA